MGTKVVIVNYGVGNLLSVSRAFSHAGADVEVTDDFQQIRQADRLVLPGVGAFGDCMDELRQRSLIPPILEFIQSDRPFLGICVGMQLLHDFGEEFGLHQGLGLIPGKVSAIPRPGANGSVYKIPHIGWNSLLRTAAKDWQGTILSDSTPGESVYFVHSYEAQLESPDLHCLAECNYSGHNITAVVQRGNAYGTQFHPEKSGPVGLKIIRRFLKI